MNDLIDRQAAIGSLYKEIIKRRLLGDVNDGMLDEFDTEDILRKLPSAQPERKTGIWILSDIQNKEDNDNGNYAYICSNCFQRDIQAKTAVVTYCWYCGAKMEKGKEE